MTIAPFVDGSTVLLNSVATGRNLAVKHDGLTGHGEDGPHARFKVTKVTGARNDCIRLQCHNDYYLGMQQDGNIATKCGKGERSVFIVEHNPNGTISLKSVECGGHIGVHDDGREKNGLRTGREPHGQFRVHALNYQQTGHDHHPCENHNENNHHEKHHKKHNENHHQKHRQDHHQNHHTVARTGRNNVPPPPPVGANKRALRVN